MSNLIEGRDYLIEKGNTVFTASFLERRGHCCGNGCRNCPYSFPNDKRVVSLVPSWTDTLIGCGVEVIARTRFCIHPTERVQGIPAVGGTKECNYDLINALHPDAVILDREENAREMAAHLQAPIVATHVKDIPSMVEGMIEINRAVKNAKLNQLIKQASALQPLPPNRLPIEKLPGLVKWVKRPTAKVHRILYLIWRDPWMAVGPRTFIGSVLAYLGFAGYLADFDQDYPLVSLSDFDRETTLFLFSTEPYPFLKKEALIRDLDLNAAIVDGECFGWYGAKAIELLRRFQVDSPAPPEGKRMIVP